MARRRTAASLSGRSRERIRVRPAPTGDWIVELVNREMECNKPTKEEAIGFAKATVQLFFDPVAEFEVEIVSTNKTHMGTKPNSNEA